MADYDDSVAFKDTQRAIMEPCTEPTVDDFQYDQDTLVWVNVSGQMRLYSYDGVNISYQTLTLSAKVNI